MTKKDDIISKLDNIQKDLEKLNRDTSWIINYLIKNQNPISIPPYIPEMPKNNKTCSKCGLSFDSITGYYCIDNNCPTFLKVSCMSSTYTNNATESQFDSLSGTRGNMSNPGDKDYD